MPSNSSRAKGIDDERAPGGTKSKGSSTRQFKHDGHRRLRMRLLKRESRASRKTLTTTDTLGAAQFPLIEPTAPEGTLQRDYEEWVALLRQRVGKPKTRLDWLQKLAEVSAGKTGKIEMLQRLERLELPITIDMTWISGDNAKEELYAALCDGNLPLLARNVARVPKMSLRNFAESLSRRSSMSIDVFDTSVSNKETASTKRIEMHEFSNIFVAGNQPTAPLNFLDIANVTGLQFTPEAILRCSLESIIRPEKRRHAGKVNDAMEVDAEWFLASCEGVTSPFHSDKAGYCTYIQALCGGKTWFWPKQHDEATRERFRELGSTFLPDNLLAVTLQPGEVFIQGPGHIHGVYSTSDCLFVGAHFYTAATFACSISEIYKQLKGLSLSNEDITDEDFSKLVKIISSIDLEGLFTREQKVDVALSLKRLTEDEDVAKQLEKKKGPKAQFFRVAKLWQKKFLMALP